LEGVEEGSLRKEGAGRENSNVHNPERKSAVFYGFTERGSSGGRSMAKIFANLLRGEINRGRVTQSNPSNRINAASEKSSGGKGEGKYFEPILPSGFGIENK